MPHDGTTPPCICSAGLFLQRHISLSLENGKRLYFFSRNIAYASKDIYCSAYDDIISTLIISCWAFGFISPGHERRRQALVAHFSGHASMRRRRDFVKCERRPRAKRASAPASFGQVSFTRRTDSYNKAIYDTILCNSFSPDYRAFS